MQITRFDEKYKRCWLLVDKALKKALKKKAKRLKLQAEAEKRAA